MTSLETIAAAAQRALLESAEGLAQRTEDAGRIARIALLCPGATASHAVSWILEKQREDGGWTDNEDSICCSALIARERGDTAAVADSIRWLESNRALGGGWGRNRREGPRVPLTAIALRFLGRQIGTRDDWLVLERLWAADLDAPVRLTYKGGFYLSCQDPSAGSSPLVRDTVRFLESQRNDDGGFGPWRHHPVGSDPWSTGVCLAGLCRFPSVCDHDVVEQATRWLAGAQLGSGYWPYHFIDEGTAYAYWGLSEAVKLLGPS